MSHFRLERLYQSHIHHSYFILGTLRIHLHEDPIYHKAQNWLLLHDNQSSLHSVYHNTVILTLVLVIYYLHKYKFQYPQLHIASQLMCTEHYS